jgi:hypothetical protein
MAALFGHPLGVEPSEVLHQVMCITGHAGATTVSPAFVAALQRQGVPKTMPVVELGSVPSMVLPGPATTASMAAVADFDKQARNAYEGRSSFLKRKDGPQRRASSTAAKPAARPVKTAGVKTTAAARPSLKHHRKDRRISPCTDEPPGATVSLVRIPTAAPELFRSA